MSLPTVDLCGLRVSRLIIGANPFGGFSHQNRQRDLEMRSWHTPERIRETWDRAWKAGITTMVTNNETPHVIQTVREYLREGGPLQWIAQLNPRNFPSMEAAIDDALEIGARAAFVHGGWVDQLHASGDSRTLARWIRHGQAAGIPMGVAGHSPEAHDWVNGLDVVDFHVVCFFNCGSVHNGKGERFSLPDAIAAAACCRRIVKPCIAYKIMGAGRIDPRMAFEFAFENIKPGDAVNVGMHRGDKDGMVEENADLVREILSESLYLPGRLPEAPARQAVAA
jgi:hypothetical protein